MITATELGRYLGYNTGFDLPLAERQEIIALDAATDDRSARRLDRIIADAMPAAPRGLRTFNGQASYADAFRTEFLAGATAPGPHRKLVDA